MTVDVGPFQVAIVAVAVTSSWATSHSTACIAETASHGSVERWRAARKAPSVTVPSPAAVGPRPSVSAMPIQAQSGFSA